MNLQIRMAVVLTALACSACSTPGDPRGPMDRSVTIAFENAKFVPFEPDRPNGPGKAVLWGDPDTGPSAIFLRVDRSPLPRHSHTFAYHLLVVKGQVKHWGPDQTESDVRPLGPGSYWFQAAGEPHGDSCLSDECVVFLVWYGRQDGRSEEPARTK